MNEMDKKLNRFNDEIIGYANEKSQIIDEKVKVRLNKELDEKEMQCLGEAYLRIQSELKKIDKEKNELASKTLMENKISLLNKRNEIIDSVKAMLKTRLSKYVKSEEYYQRMLNKINDHVDFMGKGDYIVYINYSDKELYTKLANRFPDISFKVERKSLDMIGGLRIHNLTNNMFIDDTLSKNLEEEMEEFLQYCGIKIDEK
ncbi:MAG: V-type ATP synthase subunit E [Vallitaleaceae bacterium]|nr:V-type ATP synthase subunit E [Vallitaleaceae bacterium]